MEITNSETISLLGDTIISRELSDYIFNQIKDKDEIIISDIVITNIEYDKELINVRV
jgi:hypothetical protein